MLIALRKTPMLARSRIGFGWRQSQPDRSWTSQLENVVMLCPGNEYVNVPFDTVTLANWARFWLAEVLNGVSELSVVP
jgi:hypothetical protein